MSTRCIRCGKPIEGVAQFCEDCAREQRTASTFAQPPSSPQPASGPVPAAAACPSCGAAVPAGAGFCASCGQKIVAGSSTCPSCGTAVPAGVIFCPSCGQRVGGQYVDYAGFWMRFLAAIVDGLILIVPQVLITVAVHGPGRFLLGTLLGFTYTVGFWLAEGATPGKMAMGIKITMANGEPITAVAAVVRYVGYIISGLILGIGYLMIAFNRQKRGLHDYLAGTVVVRKG